MEDSSREEPIPKPPEIPIDPMEFLSRSWSLSSLEVSKTVVSIPDVATSGAPPIPEETHDVEEEAAAAEVPISTIVGGNPFSFASSVTSQIVLDRILSHSTQQGVPPTLPSGRLSHSSGPLTGSTAASLTDSPPPVSPPRHEDSKYRRSNTGGKRHPRGGSKTMGRWLKDRKEKKKEEARVHNAQLHAAVSVAGVAAAVAAATAATSTASAPPKKGDTSIKTEAAVASAAALVAAQCAEAAEAMGVERDQLSSVVQSAVSFRTPADIITLTAAAATALRAATTLKARVTKDAWNIAAVIPVDKGAIAGNLVNENRRNSFEGKNCSVDNFLGFGNREFLARGTELLKRTRKGHLHWKIVSVYINHGTGQVMLKMKSKRVVGTITKKKKYEITKVCKNIEAWPGRHLLEGGDQRRYFGLKTVGQRVIEFECWSQQYEAWTQGVAYLLSVASERGGDV